MGFSYHLSPLVTLLLVFLMLTSRARAWVTRPTNHHRFFTSQQQAGLQQLATSLHMSSTTAAKTPRNSKTTIRKSSSAASGNGNKQKRRTTERAQTSPSTHHQQPSISLKTSAKEKSQKRKKIESAPVDGSSKVLNLSTITKEELTTVVQAWGHPRFRADQIWNWIRTKGVTDANEMNNIPKKLREQLLEYSRPDALELVQEMRSKDGTIKRAYRCHDGQLIESVLMPYQDGRYTACISSQAGCAQGCVFCATGQMGFSRQLTAEEIFEQVSRFATELQHGDHTTADEEETRKKTHGRSIRLSNVVFMGMGEPLANYRHVRTAVNRITSDLGIGARKITISTVGIVPNIRKLIDDPDMPQVRLAVSLHCASDEERDKLMPVNLRYGGLAELFSALQDYITETGRRVTLEWALIAGENDTPETARQLGRLLTKSMHKLRRDMVHINVIPLNPTGGFGGNPSNRLRVNEFVQILEKDFGVACTPRVRRGIDIDAGCGQLKSKVLENEKEVESKTGLQAEIPEPPKTALNQSKDVATVDFHVSDDAVDFDDDDFPDPEYETSESKAEAARLLGLVKGTTINLSILPEIK